MRLLLGREVGNLLRFDPLARQGSDPEGVHQLRVNARRLRSELRVVARVLKSQPLSELDKELRWIGAILGRQRDLDVLDQLLRSVSDHHVSLQSTSVLSELHGQRSSESRHIAKLLHSKRYRRLLSGLSGAVIDPPLRSIAAQPANSVLLPGLRDALSNLFRSVDDLDDVPTNDALHRIRITAKQCRYSADIASSYLGNVAKSVASSLAEVQTVLGNVHDRVVAIAYLKEASPNAEDSVHSSETVESIGAAIHSLLGSIEELKTQWREPIENARTISMPLLIPDQVRTAGTSPHPE